LVEKGLDVLDLAGGGERWLNHEQDQTHDRSVHKPGTKDPASRTLRSGWIEDDHLASAVARITKSEGGAGT